MGVAFGSVEEKVADAGSCDMLVFRSHVSEDNAGGDLGASPLMSGLTEVGFTKIREAKQPEDSFRKAREDAEPGAKGGRFDLDEMP